MRTGHGLLRAISALILAATASVAVAAWTDPVPETYPVPGGIAVVDVAAPEDPRPELMFGGHRILVVPRRHAWVAVTGLPVNLPPGNYILTGHGVSSSLPGIDFDVRSRRFEVRNLEPMVTVTDADTPEYRERLRSEARELRSLIATYTEVDDVDLQFRMPVTGNVRTPFGVRRLLGDELLPHTDSLEIDALPGAPVHAPARGTVLHTAHYLHRGRTVIIDHGQGLLSVLAHLDEIAVDAGRDVQPGMAIGRVGVTGRVAQPTLSWTVILNRTPIDPEAMLRVP